MTDKHCHACEKLLETNKDGKRKRGTSWDIIKDGTWEYMYSLCVPCYRATSEINNDHRKYKQ